MLKNTLLFLSGALVLFIAMTAVRFITYKSPDHTHFHANFAVFINGKRVDFTADKYMEEIGACMVDTSVQPRQRAHLHEKNQDTIHVHHDGVTWGHFFQNLGWNLGKDYIVDEKGVVYKSGLDGKNLTLVLNGKVVDNLQNKLIVSTDRLLVNYGMENSESIVNNRFKEVSDNAKEFNTKQDPATCSGIGEDLSFGERLKKAILD